MFGDSKNNQKLSGKDLDFVRFRSLQKWKLMFFYYLGVSGARKDLKNVFFTTFRVDKAFQNVYEIIIFRKVQTCKNDVTLRRVYGLALQQMDL